MRNGKSLIRRFGLLVLAAAMTVGNLACVIAVGGHRSRCNREVVEIDGQWYMIDCRTREARRIHIIESDDRPRPERSE